MKRWIAILLALVLLFALAGCNEKKSQETVPTTQPATEPVVEGKQVQLCLPEKSARWEDCAKQLTKLLQDLGHTVGIHYAKSDVSIQQEQIRSLAREGADLLVVAAVDSMALGQTITAAAESVKVVTLDRQVLYAEGVLAAVTYDYLSLGVAMGSQIAEEKALATAKEEKRSYTIEFFMGSADDQNAVLLHQGILAVLQPYLDTGVLKSKTGRVLLEDTYIQKWDTDLAKTKCAQYLKSYKDTPVDILCAASDTIAAGCIEALTEAGYTAENWPMITGMGGDNGAIRQILEGKQTATVYRDAEAMYETCSQVVHALLTEQPLPTQDNALQPGNSVYICPTVTVAGVKELAKLLDYGLTEKQLELTKEDVEKIHAPEEAVPQETTPEESSVPTEPSEPTEPNPTETTAAAS